MDSFVNRGFILPARARNKLLRERGTNKAVLYTSTSTGGGGGGSSWLDAYFEYDNVNKVLKVIQPDGSGQIGLANEGGEVTAFADFGNWDPSIWASMPLATETSIGGIYADNDYRDGIRIGVDGFLQIDPSYSSGGAEWGNITGTLSNQTDLQAELDAKLGVNDKAADSELLDGIDSGQFLRSDADDTATGNITFTEPVSITAPQGTPPLTITSTTYVPNLNADMLDGYHANMFAKGDSVAYTVNTGWVRIAAGNSNAAHNIAIYNVKASRNGHHNSLAFSVAASYGHNPSVVVLNNSTHNLNGISQIRIVEGDTYDQPFVELYITGDGTGIVINTANPIGWLLYTAPQTGGIPSGYSATTLTVGTTGITTTGTINAGSNITAVGEITAYYSSDNRLKKDVEDLNYGLDKILSLRPVKFRWNDKAKELAEYKDDKPQLGLIAQETEEEVPEVVGDIYEDYKGIKYEMLVPVLIKAIQELNEKVERLEKEVKDGCKGS